MENVILNQVGHCGADGTEAELTVRGHKVLAIFAPSPNTQIYQQIKKILSDAYICNFPDDYMCKIGQNRQSVR